MVIDKDIDIWDQCLYRSCNIAKSYSGSRDLFRRMILLRLYLAAEAFFPCDIVKVFFRWIHGLCKTPIGVCVDFFVINFILDNNYISKSPQICYRCVL